MAPSDQSSGGGGPSHISRRTLAKGVAWTTPVVMLGVPVPAFAASGCCVNPTWTGAEYSGNNAAWTLDFTLENCGTQPLRLTMLEVLIRFNGTGDYQVAHSEQGNLSAIIDPGETVIYDTGKQEWDECCWANSDARACYYEAADERDADGSR